MEVGVALGEVLGLVVGGGLGGEGAVGGARGGTMGCVVGALSTLPIGGPFGGLVGVVVCSVVVGGFCVVVDSEAGRRMSVICCSVPICVSVSGAKGELTLGCLGALIMSWQAACMVTVGLGVGIRYFLGYQERLSTFGRIVLVFQCQHR